MIDFLQKKAVLSEERDLKRTAGNQRPKGLLRTGYFVQGFKTWSGPEPCQEKVIGCWKKEKTTTGWRCLDGPICIRAMQASLRVEAMLTG